MKKILFSVLSICCLGATSFAQPASNPESLPTLTAAQVISIYTDNFYSDLTGVNFNPNWGQSGFATATTFTLNGNNMRHYPNMNYQGIDIKNGAVNPPQNVSSMETLHLDIWTTNCTSLDIFLVTEANGERKINTPLNLNTWNRIQIPLSSYAALGIPLTAIKEFKFEKVTPAGGADIYIDNIFFFTTATLPTLSNFSIPSKFINDAPFAITPPTSNSSGAFSYMSSNPNVATIEGNMITIVGGGTSTITATQAADGSFASGSITADFLVSVAPISTPAPIPTKDANKVISLFSDTYPNVPVTTWRTDWSAAGSTVLDTAIDGNNVKKYSNIDFVGIELPPIDVTLADSVHISVWTPSAPTFALKLVNQTGPSDPQRENIVSFRPEAGSHTYGPKPTQGQWNVYSIPLSLYATPNGALVLTSRNALFQILFVGDAPFGNNVYYVDDIYFSSTNNILPVDFKSFDINKANNEAQLIWTVGTEDNLQTYAVEKGADGKEFKEIATINATGRQRYSYADKDLANGTSYYRIKAVDRDGSFKYSTIKSIFHDGNDNLAYSIYPNPASNELVIKNLTGNNTISIVDASGRVVMTRKDVSIGLATINISTLKSGFYSVIINNGVESKALKIVVNK